MKRFTILILLVLLQGVATVDGQIKSGLNTVLWKIEDLGSAHTSYLLGTNHFYGEEWLKSYPKIDTLLAASDTFICESLHGTDTTALRKLQYQLLSEKRTAKELFKDNFDLVNDYFENTTGSGLIENIDNNSESRVVVLHRMFIYLLDEIGTKNKYKVAENGVPMDKVLLQSATLKNKKNIGLDAIAVVTKIYLSDKFIDGLCSYIGELVTINSQDLSVLNSSSKKSYDQIVSVLGNYNKGTFGYNFTAKPTTTAMLEKRNKIWIKKLPDLLKKSNSFVAVGALHLDSKIGIIPELQKMGFVITAVDLN